VAIALPPAALFAPRWEVLQLLPSELSRKHSGAVVVAALSDVLVAPSIVFVLDRLNVAAPVFALQKSTKKPEPNPVVVASGTVMVLALELVS
jgi:hypothetical protein